jgi:hypothetical protein
VTGSTVPPAIPPTSSAATSPAKLPWWQRPRVAIPLAVALLLAVTILTPEARTGRQGDSRLSTYNTGPLGAGALYELARRLGWSVTRTNERVVGPFGADSIRAILAPALPLAASEAHAMLEHVRGGGALFLVLGANGALEDSLGVSRRQVGVLTPALTDSAARHEERCDETRGPLTMWPTRTPYVYALRWDDGPPPGMVTFAHAKFDEGEKRADTTDRMSTVESEADTSGGPLRPAAVGYPLGAGRVAIVSDPDMLRNDVLRVCAWDADVVAVRMLEYLSRQEPRRAAIVFDEYHQGYGAHPGSFTAITRYLWRTSSGRTLLQLAIAGLVLLAATAPRPIPPRDDTRVERRSPLEHVDALARAYRQVHATRTATQRLLRGVRRRSEGRVRTVVHTDEAFLDAVEARHPELAEDVRLVRRAAREPVSGLELERAGVALERIETSLTTTRT